MASQRYSLQRIQNIYGTKVLCDMKTYPVIFILFAQLSNNTLFDDPECKKLGVGRRIGTKLIYFVRHGQTEMNVYLQKNHWDDPVRVMISLIRCH